jgi:predicted transcriptional regulator
MNSLTVRISKTTHATLRSMATESNESMTEILDKAIEAYRRQRFFDELNASFATLRSDPGAWAEEVAERSAWEGTLGDGLEAE